MIANRKFALIHMCAKNQDLIKDGGMVPYYFHKLFNFESEIITFNNDNYPYLDIYTKGLRLNFIKKNFLSSRMKNICEISVVRHLLFNAKKINILCLLTFTLPNMIYGIVYKLLNRKGFLYLKMDVNDSFKIHNFKKWYMFVNKRFPLDFFVIRVKKFIGNIFYKIVNLISFETRALYEFCKKNSPNLRHKLILAPNGIDDLFFNSKKSENFLFSEKENLILTVGRLGTHQKATEVLINAISKIKDLKDWKVFLIGPLTRRFRLYLSNFLKENPLLKEKLFFIGEVDRDELFEYYKKSKIFCLPSRYEGHPLALIQAAYFGNYPVATNLHFSKEITLNGSLGKLFKIDDSDELADILQNLINNNRKLENNFLKLINHTKENFSWSKTISRLYLEIMKRRIKNF